MSSKKGKNNAKKIPDDWIRKGFVYLKPGDKISYPPALFSIDPEVFTPDPDEFRLEYSDGTSEVHVHNWGLKTPEDHRGSMVATMENLNLHLVHCSSM